jgi:hypothetical protein
LAVKFQLYRRLYSTMWIHKYAHCNPGCILSSLRRRSSAWVWQRAIPFNIHTPLLTRFSEGVWNSEFLRGCQVENFWGVL